MAQKSINEASGEKLITEILGLIHEQTETLKNKPISPTEAAAYRERAWRISELVRLLDTDDGI